MGVVQNPAIDIVKDADASKVNAAGSHVTYAYTVNNTGNVSLTGVTVVDDNSTPGNPADDFNPIFVGGDTDNDGELDVTETWTYTATVTVSQDQMDAGQDIVNVATVTTDQGVSDSDEAIVGVEQNLAIDIEKATNSEDADTPTGPEILVGETATFTYVVTNTGNVSLMNVTVTDDQLGPITNIIDQGNGDLILDVGESWTYEASITVTAGQYANQGTVTALSPREVTAIDHDPSHHLGVLPRQDFMVLGNDKGTTSEPWITILDTETGAVRAQFLAYEQSYAGGVRVATGDMDGDGIPEIITAPGTARLPEVRVFKWMNSDQPNEDQIWGELLDFRTVVHNPSFTGGVDVAVGDVDGDGLADLVTTPSTFAARTKVFLNRFGSEPDPIRNTPDRQFFPFGSGFEGGSVVALADMNSDGKADVVVGSAGSMRSTVLAFDVQPSTPKLLKTFLPFSDKMRGGVAIDLGDITGDGTPDLMVGAGYRGTSSVEVFDGDSGAKMLQFQAYTGSSKNAPVRVAGQDTDNDGLIDHIVTAQGPNGNTNEIRSFDIFFDNIDSSWKANLDSIMDLDDLNDPKLFGAYFLDFFKLGTEPQ